MFLYSYNTCMILIHFKYLIEFFIFIQNFFTSNFESHIGKITMDMDMDLLGLAI